MSDWVVREDASALDLAGPGDRIGIDVGFSDGRRAECHEQRRIRVVIVEIIPFVGALHCCGQAAVRRVHRIGDRQGSGRRAFGMACEAAADRLSVPRPMLVGVRRRMDGEHAAARTDELLQRIATASAQPFGSGVLRIGRRVEEDDYRELRQTLRREDCRVLVRLNGEAALDRKGANGIHSCRNGFVPIARRPQKDQDGLGRRVLCRRRCREDEDEKKNRIRHGVAYALVESKRAAR